MLENIHFINNNSTFIGYNIDNNRLIRFTPQSYRLASRLKEQEHITTLAHQFSATEQQIIDFAKHIEMESNNNKLITNNIQKGNKFKTIDRITLHISNSCNLRCTYCYANGGNYNMPEGIMNEKTADDIVAFLNNTFDKIGDIVFFGGEPLLNYKILERICIKLSQNNKLKISHFNIITNGTILNDDILRILNKYINTIVVSI